MVCISNRSVNPMVAMKAPIHVFESRRPSQGKSNDRACSGIATTRTATTRWSGSEVAMSQSSG